MPQGHFELFVSFRGRSMVIVVCSISVLQVKQKNNINWGEKCWQKFFSSGDGPVKMMETRQG